MLVHATVVRQMLLSIDSMRDSLFESVCLLYSYNGRVHIVVGTMLPSNFMMYHRYAHNGLSQEGITRIIDEQMTENGSFIVYRRRDSNDGYTLSYREIGSGAVMHVNIEEEGYGATPRLFAIRGDKYRAPVDACMACLSIINLMCLSANTYMAFLSVDACIACQL